MPAAPTFATLWFHPQRGAWLSVDSAPPLLHWKRRGGTEADWCTVAKVRVRSDSGTLVPAPNETLPAGFLWADPTKQAAGLGGPYLAYGPIRRVCRDCKQPFTWSARAQQQLYEVARANSDAIALSCQRCARARRQLEAKRAAYAEALRALERMQTPERPDLDETHRPLSPELARAKLAACHLAVAHAIHELVNAGGRASLDRAIGHCRSARKLGLPKKANALEAKLRTLRATKASR